MNHSFFSYLIFCVIMSSTIAWGEKIQYDPGIENQLKTSYSIVLVPQIKESQEGRKERQERQERQENTLVKLSLNLAQPELYDQGEDGACAFFSTVCAMLMVDSGKKHLKKMFLGQDEGFVYIKFPDPSPFGITDIDEFLGNFEGNWHFGFDKAQYLKKNVFKVTKEIVEEHAPLAGFPNAPGWFRLLAAAYLKVTEFIDSNATDSDDSNDEETSPFEYLPTSFHVSYFPNEIQGTDIDILSGKPLAFDLDIEKAYKKEELPPVSLLLDKPIRNCDDFHGRAMHFSKHYVHFFDSLEAEKKVFSSNLFNESVNIKDLEEELIKNRDLLEEKNSLLAQVRKEMEKAPSSVEEKESRKRLVRAYELSCSKFANALEGRFPLCESCKPLNPAELPTKEFLTRLYGELLKYNFFKMEVLDI